MRKNVWVTLITLITLSFGYPLNSYSDIITKDGVKIQFFRKGQKKSVSKEELLSSGGFQSIVYDYLEKIVFSPSKNDPQPLSIKIYDRNNQLLMRKDKILIYGEKITFSIYPWLNSWDEDENSSAKYRIIISRMNEQKDEKVIDVIYTLYTHEGD